MSATLAANEKAPVLDQDGNQLSAATSSFSSSDITVLTVVDAGGPGNPVFAIGQAAGSATITAQRTADGAVTTLDVTVTASALPPFAIALGAAVPK